MRFLKRKKKATKKKQEAHCVYKGRGGSKESRTGTDKAGEQWGYCRAGVS